MNVQFIVWAEDTKGREHRIETITATECGGVMQAHQRAKILADTVAAAPNIRQVVINLERK